MRIKTIVAVTVAALAVAGCERAKKAGSDAVRLGEKAAHQTGKVVGNTATAFFSGVGEGIDETAKRLDKGAKTNKTVGVKNEK